MPRGLALATALAVASVCGRAPDVGDAVLDDGQVAERAATTLRGFAGADAAWESSITLPPVFGDHMVLQRDTPVAVWGQAPASAEVEVAFGDHRAVTRADAEGRWAVQLPPMPADGTGRNLSVRAGDGEELVLRDVVCGDVWLCSGQSNMRWRVHESAEATEMLAGADLPELRLLDFEGTLDPSSEQYDVESLRGLTADNQFTTAGWQRSTPRTARSFSAVAFAFGRRLAVELAVPIGLVHNAIGGSPMEAWLPPDGETVEATVREVMDGWLTDPRYPAWCRQRVDENLATWLQDPAGARPHHPFEPSFLYQAGIAPLGGFTLRGCIWYQGESNATGDPALGKAAFVSLIRSFRAAFDDPDLPFYFVQLPGMNRDWPRFREVQLEVAREVPDTGMAVTIDVGHPTDVHPRRKLPVGQRLARLALAGTYGRDVVPSGPLLREAVRVGARMRLRFDHAIGLRTSDGESVRGFVIAAADREFHVAYAAIEGEDVIVEAAEVTEPVAVRYGFGMDPDTNLVNAALLPASPFRTDRWDDVPVAAAAARCGFEDVEVGELRELTTPVGTFEAASGHAEISNRFAYTGRQCLRLLGGRDRALVLVRDAEAAGQLSFRAERWTRRDPFEFRIEARRGGTWAEVYNGDDAIRVGARFLSRVRVDVPAGSTALRFRCSSPEGSGLLIDDLQLERPRPMRAIGSGHAHWTAPALLGRVDNPVTKVEIATSGSASPLVVQRLEVTIPSGTRLEDIARVRVLYDGTEPFGEAQTAQRQLAFRGRQPLYEGANRFFVSVELAPDASFDRRVTARCAEVILGDGTTLRPAGSPTAQRVGIALRTAGQDDCSIYRIPGLATTRAGTLVAVYDCRYRGGGDLPGDIDVGMSRSTDGGRTWEPRRVIMDMGNDPKWRFDGVGDPAVLVDRVGGTIWVAATWSHGDRSWNGSGPGLTPDETGQLMLVRSDDDGRTWSKPINITRQVKDPAWRFVLQGPGNGITLRDGTLAFAAQYRSADGPPFSGKPFSTLIWSTDRGESWHIGTGVEVDTTEAQLVELADGSLMINCRDNRGSSRSVYTTRDLGATWQVHPTSRSALPEPVCMASLIRVEHARHGALLLFSNPATRAGRRDLTLKVSRDEGRTRPARWHTLYDQRDGFGYSCLTRVDAEHIGVLYEGRGELYFLRVPIRELVGR